MNGRNGRERPARDRAVWNELIAGLAVTCVLFTVMIPQFLHAQARRQVESVRAAVDSIAGLLASTPGVFAEIDRGYVSFPVYNTVGGYKLTNYQVLTTQSVEWKNESRQIVHPVSIVEFDMKPFQKHYPEILLPQYDGDVEFRMLMCPEYFVVWANLGSLTAHPVNALGECVLDEEGFCKPSPQAPLYDASNGIKSSGYIIKTSYGLGWRIAPDFLRGAEVTGGREPIDWQDWTKCRRN
ncbi:MAG: hypothetical protein GC154_12045 [bacterium]|nr:hypothetical protein [bacterium]